MMRRSSRPACAASNVATGTFMRTSPFAGTLSACMLRHSLGSNARHVCATTTIVNPITAQTLLSRRNRCIRFIFCGGGQKPLIQKRCENCDDCDGDERADAIQLIKLGKIVKEKFHDCDAEQCQACVARRRGSFSDSDNEQKKGE